MRVHVFQTVFGDALRQWGNLQSKSVVSTVPSANDLCSADTALISFPSRLRIRDNPLADNARQHARWAIMTVTPFEVFIGLVIIAALIMIALAVRRWDD